MPFFRKRNAVEAVRFWGSLLDLPQEFKEMIVSFNGGTCIVDTPDGTKQCRAGDWIIKTDDGFYTMKDTIFEKKFVAVGVDAD